MVCEEIKRSQDTPARRASRDLFSTAFQVHPYRHPVIGTEQSVRSFTREKVLEFYHRHYSPQNLVLSAVGDLSEPELRQWVEEIFGGDWGRPYEGLVQRSPEPATSGRRLLLREDDVKEAYLHLGFSVPQADHPDVPALDVLAMLAGQGDASRLVVEVKRKAELVNDIHASAYTPRDPGIFTVSLTLPPENVAKALEETLRVMAELRVRLVSSRRAGDDQVPGGGRGRLSARDGAGHGAQDGLLPVLDGRAGGGGALLRGSGAAHPRGRARRWPSATCASTGRSSRGCLPQGTAFTQAQAEEILDAVMHEAPTLRPERRTRKPGSDVPMRIVRSGTSTGEIIQETLPSGARIMVREEHGVPLFSLRAAFAGGQRYETPAINGLSTLLGRTLTRGTRTKDAEEISQLVDAYAGSLAGVGGRNSVGVRGRVPLAALRVRVPAVRRDA